MTSRRALGAPLGLAAVLLGLVAGVSAVPAGAAPGSPPVTTPDTVTVLQANAVAVKPVNNDHDPDNELVALCPLGTEHYRGPAVDIFRDELDVYAKPRARPGTYTFTYYACDYSYLVPGTVTVTVKELPKIPVHKIASRPGALRVTNPTTFSIRFLYGSFKADATDGSVLI